MAKMCPDRKRIFVCDCKNTWSTEIDQVVNIELCKYLYYRVKSDGLGVKSKLENIISFSTLIKKN